MSETARLLVAERSSIGAARTATRRLAALAGFDEERTSQALIVASELATNLVRHAGSGSFAVQARPGGLSVLTWDEGPGIPDVGQAFADGFSTSGTSGTGLGAVRRLADAVDVRSVRGEGTIVAAHLGARNVGAAGYRVDGLAVPLSGEGPSGDAWAVRADGDAVTVLLADGLGHGPQAALAADAAVACLRDGGDRGPGELLSAVHDELRRSRGAAVAVVRLEPAQGQLRFAGVGNVTALIVATARRRTLLNHHGIVGREVRRIQELSYPLAADDAVVLHTDGVREGFDPAAHRAVLHEDPLVVAATVVRAGERGRDDVGAVAAVPGAPA